MVELANGVMEEDAFRSLRGREIGTKGVVSCRIMQQRARIRRAPRSGGWDALREQKPGTCEQSFIELPGIAGTSNPKCVVLL